MARVRLIHTWLEKQRRLRAQGASLIEVIIASVVMLLALTAVVPLYTMAVRDYGTSTASVDLQNRLDADFAAVRQLGEKFSWCSGSGSTTVAVGGTCTTAVVGGSSGTGSSAYYVPDNSASTPAVGPNLRTFWDACAAGTTTSDPLTANLVLAINNSSVLPFPTGLRRVATLDMKTIENDVSSHRLLIEYFQTSDNTKVGALVYTPPVVAYCP